MALDIYKLESGGPQELLLSIDDNGYSILSTAFNIYEKRTGLYVDPYGKLKLSSGLAPLLSVIYDTYPKDRNIPEIVKALLITLQKAEAEHYGIIFEGD